MNEYRLYISGTDDLVDAIDTNTETNVQSFDDAANIMSYNGIDKDYIYDLVDMVSGKSVIVAFSSYPGVYEIMY